MASKLDKFSESEQVALQWAREGRLVSSLGDKVEKGVFGEVVAPSLRVVRGLERKGFLYITEEDPVDVNGEPFEFTPMICLTEEGYNLFKPDECPEPGM